MPRHLADGQVKTADKLCAKCGNRTYRISTREGTELRVSPAPGPHGTHSFTVAIPNGENTRNAHVVICSSCFSVHFQKNPARVSTWVLHQAGELV